MNLPDPLNQPAYTLGLMSGTSLDGLDAALVRFQGEAMHLIAATCTPLPPELRKQLLQLQTPGDNELHQAALAANGLADLCADAVASLLTQAGLPASAIAAIGLHGQTLRHQPAQGYTLQIGNAARLAERTGITVVHDFRSRDIAAGGQGAPLVPAFHAALFGHAHEHRVVINVGGMANMTDLPPGGPVRGWDTGPGNVLLDGWIQQQRGLPYDADGAWARTGQVVEPLLAEWLATPYFALPPPKSTGREAFGADWLAAHTSRIASTTGRRHAPEDIQATLLELTARSLADSVAQECRGAEHIYICGGGAHNARLCQRLAALLAPCPVASTAALGLEPDWVEACAFAWLARQTLLARPGNLPDVTGARGLRVLGAVHAA